jgi:hypothetical protein
LLAILLSGFCVVGVSGQGLECSPPETKCECNGVVYCCKGIGTCLPGRKPANNCDTGYADLLEFLSDETMLEAAYYTKASGEAVTQENVKKNQERLRDNPALREALTKARLAALMG